MTTAMRIPLVAGNWKMHLHRQDAAALGAAVRDGVCDLQGVEVVVCPVFTALTTVQAALNGGPVGLGAQNCYHEASGAFTGEIAPEMLLDCGCSWVIIGHSERRQIFGEDDALLNRKLRYALGAGIKVMFCIGETLEEREGGAMEAVLERQLRAGLEGLEDGDFARMAIAYEPVWAIGTGKTASPAQAQEAHLFVRGVVRELFGERVADVLRIQYGGSVKPDNAGELIGQPDVDGFLVGGASLQAESFAAIATAAA